jgi:hypothetical protein
VSSLKDATKPRDTSNMVLVTAPPSSIPPPPLPTGDPGFSPLMIAPIPPVLGTAADQLRQFYRASTSQIRMSPLPVAANPATGAQVASHISQVSENTIELQTNGVDNPAQNILNITGSGVSYGPNPGQVNIESGGTGDGLAHGTTPWETDPSAVILTDDFVSGNVTSGGVGAMGWSFLEAGSGVGSVYHNMGGAFPNCGEFALGAVATANYGYILTPFFQNSNTYPSGGFLKSFVEAPSWKMSWVFRLMPNALNATDGVFDLTNRALYLGLCSPAAQSQSFAQRPYNFVGLRFDQDTTAPSIGDTTFHFEVLQNGPTNATTRTSSNGANNQGGATFSITSTSCTSNVITVTAANTLQVNSMVKFSNLTTSTFLNGVTANVASATSTSFTINYTHANYSATTETGTATLGGSVVDTGISPSIGKYYRLDMTCTTAGSVTMTLSDGTTTYTATMSVPQYSFLATWTIANDWTGEFRLQAGGSGTPLGPTIFAAGAAVTFSGFTSSAAVYNGAQTVFNNNDSSMEFLTSQNTGPLSNITGTVTGYPSHVIGAIFGTTTSGTGTASCALHIDFFGFAWNPGVNASNALTPNSVKPRYW